MSSLKILTGEWATEATVSNVRDAGEKGCGILQGTQHKVSDWSEASRGARYCLHLMEKKRVKIMVKLFRYIEHKMINDLL